MDPVTETVQTLTKPVSIPTDALFEGVGDFSFGLFKARRLAVENRRLYDRLASIALYAETTERLERDIDSLRKQLRLPSRPGKVKVPADVVGYIPRDNRLTINVGSKSGVRPGLPVVGAAGLIGTVQTVSPSTSQVLLLTSHGLTIGAIVLNRNPSPAGLLRGEDSSTLSLSFNDPKATVQIGDTIASSGLSEFIPRGIPIGRVIQVIDDEAFGERRAVVDPFVVVGELKEVTVLK
jgi:rod shape-determining protein MreC